MKYKNVKEMEKAGNGNQTLDEVNRADYQFCNVIVHDKVDDVLNTISSSPKRTGYKFNHIVNIFELFSHIVRELDLEFILDQHSEFHIIQII
jgi:hypothetical protein